VNTIGLALQLKLLFTSPTQGATVEGTLRERRAQGYESPRPEVQALVPKDAQRILELGCSTGALGAALKARNGAFVLGVEVDPEYARQAEDLLDRVVVSDAECFVRTVDPDITPFDCLIGADVFEHLVDPWSALERATELLVPGATVVVSLPNVLYWPGLWRVIRDGRWPRDAEGTFDRTHLRWFTTRDAVDLLEGAGLYLESASPVFRSRGLRLAATKAWQRTPFRRFLALQWLFVAVKP
jgi:2-polyprenyl-3-methyl-5-hydroxy-6-metoxy-1,4-benzoquinol methylase